MISATKANVAPIAGRIKTSDEPICWAGIFAETWVAKSPRLTLTAPPNAPKRMTAATYLGVSEVGSGNFSQNVNARQSTMPIKSSKNK